MLSMLSMYLGGTKVDAEATHMLLSALRYMPLEASTVDIRAPKLVHAETLISGRGIGGTV